MIRPQNKKYKILYMGNWQDDFLSCLLNFQEIELIGMILDTSASMEKLQITRQKMAEHKIVAYTFADISQLNPDLIFLCTYSKLIASDYLEKYLFVNVHAGILPKWRGSNANCWAILNGESEVGYTLHRVNREMDAGNIYHITKVRLQEFESYFRAKRRIINKLLPDLENIFVHIIEGKNRGTIQAEDNIAYTTALQQNDGIITDFNKKADYIAGLWRVFSLPPEGTGTIIRIKNKSYYIGKIAVAKNIMSYQGIAGAVLNKYEDGSILVKTKDSAVRIFECIDREGKKITPADITKIGWRL